MPASNKVFGYTQTELAKRSGLKQPHISSYLTGKNVPSLRNVVKIANACGLTIDEVSNYIIDKCNNRKQG